MTTLRPLCEAAAICQNAGLFRALGLVLACRHELEASLCVIMLPDMAPTKKRVG